MPYSCNIGNIHGLKLYFGVLEDMMDTILKMRTPEQRAKKRLNEERVVMDLHLAIKKETFRNLLKTKPEIQEGYVKVSERIPHDCFLFDSKI